MLKDRAVTPKFTKGQVVRVSLCRQDGQVKNELARKCLRYSSECGTVSSWGLYFLDSGTRLVYHVRMNDGKVLLVTEDCLVPVKDPA